MKTLVLLVFVLSAHDQWNQWADLKMSLFACILFDVEFLFALFRVAGRPCTRKELSSSLFACVVPYLMVLLTFVFLSHLVSWSWCRIRFLSDVLLTFFYQIASGYIWPCIIILTDYLISGGKSGVTIFTCDNSGITSWSCVIKTIEYIASLWGRSTTLNIEKPVCNWTMENGEETFLRVLYCTV